jgi:DNA-binding NtrC family response regulator
MHRAVVLAAGTTIHSGHLPPEGREASSMITIRIPRTSEELKHRKKELRERAVEEVERRFVEEALKRIDWSVTRTAADEGTQRLKVQALRRDHQIVLPKSSPPENGRYRPNSLPGLRL